MTTADMVGITPQVQGRYPGRAPIEAYGNGGFRFAGMSHRGSILCLPSAISAWNVASAAGLTPASFDSVLAEHDQIEILLVGVGRNVVLLPRAITDVLRAAGIGVDAMDTGAACRTYNVLLAEGRSVAAALMAVD